MTGPAHPGAAAARAWLERAGQGLTPDDDGKEADVADVALVFPGQGSHRAGMASAWSDHPAAAPTFAEVATATGLDIGELADDPAACAATSVAQPALFAVSVVAWRALLDAGVEPALVAGHSLGEITAAVAAGCLSVPDGARLVADRGRAMGEACARSPGSMAAVLGLDDEARDQLRERLPAGVAVANENAPGQVVLSGPPEAVEGATGIARDLGARVRPLDVEGAFHSEAMAPAVRRVAAVLRDLQVADPAVPLVTGVSGRALTRGADVTAALVDGLLRPVRWRAVQETLVASGAGLILESGPGGVLKGLARRTVDVPALTVDTPAALDAARESVVRLGDPRGSPGGRAAERVGSAGRGRP